MVGARKTTTQLDRKDRKKLKSCQKQKLEFSKKLISDIRWLLWAVTLGGLALAAFCIYRGYVGSLPWISTLVGLPWTAHGVVCSFYLNMAKSDHSGADGEGITYAAAKAAGFIQDTEFEESPAI